MIQSSFFPEPPVAVPDDEVVAVLRNAIACGGRLSRSAELLICGMCADHLLGELHAAGLVIVRQASSDQR